MSPGLATEGAGQFGCLDVRCVIPQAIPKTWRTTYSENASAATKGNLMRRPWVCCIRARGEPVSTTKWKCSRPWSVLAAMACA